MGVFDISEEVGALKKAAIDAYMTDNRYRRVPEENLYRYSVREYEPAISIAHQPKKGTVYYEVTMPGADGSGGGVGSVRYFPASAARDFPAEPQDFTGHFQTIRNRIGQVTNDWTSLPDPEGLAPSEGTAKHAFMALSSGADAGLSGDSEYSIGDMNSYLGDIERSLEDLSAQTLDLFRTKFVSKLPQAIGNYQGLAAACWACVASERALWTSVRTDVRKLLTSSTNKFNEVAESNEATNWSEALAVLNIVSKTVGALLPSGLSIVTDLAGIGIEAAKEATAGSDSLSANAGDFETTMSGFETLMDEFSDKIRAEENALVTMLSENYSTAVGNASAFDLTADSSYAESQPTNLNIDSGRVETAIRSMWMLAASVSDIRDQVKLGFWDNEVLRFSQTGLGPTGPTDDYNNVTGLLSTLLADLSWELDNSAGLLNSWLSDMGLIDEQSATAVAETYEQGLRMDAETHGNEYDGDAPEFTEFDSTADGIDVVSDGDPYIPFHAADEYEESNN